MLIFIFLLFEAYTQGLQEKEHIFKNSNFIVSYSLERFEAELRIKGSIVSANEKKIVTEVNIWSDCKNKEGSINGTVPATDGKFTFIHSQNLQENTFP